jgi:hypothetical protein
MKERKTLSGVMNLDDFNNTFPLTHHKEARNGVFRGNGASMKFQSAKGNQKKTNTQLIKYNCSPLSGLAWYPICTLTGTATAVSGSQLLCLINGIAVQTYSILQSSSCNTNQGISTYTIKGKVGDRVELHLEFTGGLQWNGNGSTYATISYNVDSVSDISGSATYPAYSNDSTIHSFNLQPSFWFNMPSSTAVITVTSKVYNSNFSGYGVKLVIDEINNITSGIYNLSGCVARL